MSFQLFDMIWTFDFRNGVGFDIEATSSRPVWTVIDNDNHVTPMAFNGLVLLLPFICVTIGNVFLLEDI
jgi:hypothetical protein|tara:strand:+ start:2310 stop:2516 length:207 start_codon:yes stop_codon:yes gene_type:complete